MPLDQSYIYPPDPSVMEDSQTGYGQMKPGLLDPNYVYECRYCETIFNETMGTGPQTGAGNMGRSYGLNIQCPRCGGTNIDGPRLKREGEVLYPQTPFLLSQPAGLDIFSNQSVVEAAQSIEQV